MIKNQSKNINFKITHNTFSEKKEETSLDHCDIYKKFFINNKAFQACL